jgi:basic membrane protein A
MRIGLACLGFLLGTAALPVVAQDAPTADDPARIILVVNGALGDRSFFDSAARGLQMIEEKYGEEVETEVLEIGDDPSAWEPALLDVSEGDWDLIIGGTFSMSEVFGSVAEQYPDNEYILFDASLPNEDGRYDNVYMVEYKQNEGSYLGGMLAASLLSSGALPAEAGSALGFTGGMDIPVINDFLVGYIAGAQAVNPDVKVAASYIGSFTDAAKGKEVGLAQFREGVALSFVAASQAGLGQIQAAAEEGRFILGVDSDQEAVLRETDAAMSDTVVSSVLKNVDVSLLRAYDLWLAGELPFGQVEKVGLAEGAVGLVETGAMSRLADQATRDAVAEATRAIEAGEIVVPTAFGMEQDALDSLRESVRP